MGVIVAGNHNQLHGCGHWGKPYVDTIQLLRDRYCSNLSPQIGSSSNLLGLVTIIVPGENLSSSQTSNVGSTLVPPPVAFGTGASSSTGGMVQAPPSTVPISAASVGAVSSQLMLGMLGLVAAAFI